MNWMLFQNSLLVAGLTTVLAVGMGLAVALWVSGIGGRWQRVIVLTSLMALVLPPFLATNTWLHYLGFTGVWRSWLPFNIYGLWGTVWVLALLLWPVTVLLVLGGWRRLEPGQLESDPAVAGWALVRWILIPLAGPALGQAAVLTFVLAFNNFAVPAILQTRVFPAEVWLRFSTMFDYQGALMLSWPLAVAPVLVLIWLGRREVVWPALDGPASARLFRRQLGGGWFWGCGLASVLILFLAVGLPLGHLALNERTWGEMPAVWATAERVMLNSLLFGGAAAAGCLGIGLLGWRWRRVGALLWLPFLLPGVLLGIGLIYLFNHPVLAGIYHGAGIVFLALIVRYLGFGWTGSGQAVRSVDRDLSDWARLHGASGWQVFRHVTWPQAAPQLAAVWYLIYLLSLWDVETLVLIVPPGGETIALRVFNLLHYGHNVQVNALCLLLLGLAVLPLALWQMRGLVLCMGSWLGLGGGARRGVALALAALIGVGAGCARSHSDEVRVQSRFFSAVQIIGSRGVGAGQMNKPRSVALDAEDNLYVVDMTGRVQKFSPDGEYLSAWQMEETVLGRPKGMTRDPDGNVIVIEPHYSRVNHFSPEGELVEFWGDPGTDEGQFMFPRAAAINSRGEIFVSEYGMSERVQKFEPAGRGWVRGFGRMGSGLGEFNRPEGLGIDAQDRLYVADSCNHRIQIFSPEGEFLRSYGRPGSGVGELSYPFDVRVDAEGYQFVCEFGNSRIQIFDAEDRPVEILGGVGSGPGRMSNPWAIALDSNGNLYVADGGNHRVKKFIRAQ